MIQLPGAISAARRFRFLFEFRLIQRQFVETHPEPGEVVVCIMEARHNGRSAEVDAAPGRQFTRIVAQGNNPPVVDCEGADGGELAARQKARSDVDRVDQHW